MTKHTWVLGALCFLFCLSSSNGFAAEMKEWTFLTYLNGHNSLDSYGQININQMEKVGSSDDVNVVVQWGSLRAKNDLRVYVKKNGYDTIQTMSHQDMGNVQTFEDFVQWGIQNYPAKHYMINIWDHGGGWHLVGANSHGIVHAQDISWDDSSGNFISTEQLGQAMNDIAGMIGHKVDIYGSDACLMAMVEVAAQMKDAVETFAGSEETIPGAGWPYAEFLTRFEANPTASSQQIATALAEEYLKSYSGGSNGRMSVTFSVIDMSKLPALIDSLSGLGAALSAQSATNIAQVQKLAGNTQSYVYGDYKDIGDFLSRLQSNPSIASNETAQAITDVNNALTNAVITSQNSSAYSNSHGLSIWLPTYSYDWQEYNQRYTGLEFDQESHWSNLLSKFSF